MGIRFLDEEAPPPSNGGMGDVFGAVRGTFLPSKGTVRFLDDEPTGSPLRQAATNVRSDALNAARNTFSAPWDFTKGLATTSPAEVQQKAGPWLPAAGAAIGTAVIPVPGLGTAVGAGAGEMLRQAGDIGFNQPGAVLAGQNFSPRAGLNAAGQTAMAGLGEVNGIVKAAPGAKPYVQRGIEAASDALAPVGNMVKKGVSRLSEAFTGVPERQAAKLIDEPGRLVSGIGQLDSRGQAVGEAEELLSNRLTSKAAANPPAAGTFRLTPEIDAAITTNKGGVADEIVTNLLTKAKNPGAISTDEAVAGIKAIDRTFPNATGKNAKIVQKYSDLRSTLSDIVANSEEGKSAGVATAKAAFNDAKVGADFRNPFRQTKTGKVSAVPFLSFLFKPENWGGEQLAGQAAKLPLFSPAVWGAGMAGGSAGVKIAGAAVANPTVRQALISRYIVSRDDKTQQ